jgi:hypothetical protein
MARVGWNGGEGEESQVGDSGGEGGSVALGEEVEREEVEAGWAGEREEDGEEKAHGWRGEARTRCSQTCDVRRAETNRELHPRMEGGLAGSMSAGARDREVGGPAFAKFATWRIELEKRALDEGDGGSGRCGSGSGWCSGCRTPSINRDRRGV